ncbi:DUF5313 family protein [Blastococcus saxobsidens]|uniref:DUF5313 domain-containing protein n=1 Tax=Blastococcus saxobsidens TaxID=138336 RepID=A0A4Q7Y9Q2_9ACTN|nr:DUF5313 family protein [Blastococcus saxobsidens]RZU32881.1 hypothetical protein BKA19_2591 [Blastococcus saxobsidens]
MPTSQPPADALGPLDVPAPDADGTPAEPVVRPAAHRWLWYALGGRLPARHRRWVLHDTTTRTWGLRHVARMLVQMAVPIALVMIFLPAPWQLRVAVAGGGIFLGLIYSLAYMPETTENRVVKAGYPAGTATAYRDRAAQLRDDRDRVRRRAAAAKRAARYRERQGR